MALRIICKYNDCFTPVSAKIQKQRIISLYLIIDSGKTLYFLKETFAVDFDSLKPSLLNRYLRKYYESCDGKYRITVDTDQSFYLVNSHGNFFLNKIADNNTVILELKYNHDYDSGASYITTKFPFRLTKSSKYVTGVERVFQMAS